MNDNQMMLNRLSIGSLGVDEHDMVNGSPSNVDELPASGAYRCEGYSGGDRSCRS